VTSYDALLNDLGRALGRDDIPKAVPEDRPQLVRHALANFRALLVLDNLETFSAEERRRVVELLDNLPSACRAIVTSRRRTDGSTAGHNLRLDKLEREAADELLAELGQRWEPVARLTQDERDRLYAETGGNPLLLTWVAGQLGRTTGRCRTVAEAIERLQEAHRLQKLDAKNDPLDFVFGDLVETFTVDETSVLAALVHFTQPAPIEWLLPLTELSRKATETALDGLRDRALLVEDDQAATWLLPPLASRFLRRTCPEAVGISGERLADQAYALTVENGYEYTQFPALEAVWPQLVAALPALITGDNRRLQAVCDAINEFLHFSGRWDDLLFLSTEAEARASLAGDLNNAGWRACDAGDFYHLRGQSAEVLACADRAAAHWQAVRAGAYERALAIRLRGLGHSLTRDYPAAVNALREALDLMRSASPKDESMVMGLLNDLAGVLLESGQLDEAETHSREALAIGKALADPRAVALIMGNLANLTLDREQWPEAEGLSREALKLAEEVGRKEMIAFDCWCLAKALVRQRRGVEGRCHAERAVAIFAELRSPRLSEAQTTLNECLG
jgi:tetratricopeptide (TPR) repeat protein